jgi:hypothetical protein
MADPVASHLTEMIVEEPEVGQALLCGPTLEKFLFSGAPAMKERPVHSRCSTSVDPEEGAANLSWEVSNPMVVLAEPAEMEKPDPNVRETGVAAGLASLSSDGEALCN